MKRQAVLHLKSLLRTLGIEVARYIPKSPGYELIEAMDSLATLRDIACVTDYDEAFRFIEFCSRHWRKSKSQLFQDLFVLYELEEKIAGFFVEFGAADGIHLSNTYSLEKDYQWNGVLSEPAHCWHGALKHNRECRLDLRCVWNKSNEILHFSEVAAAELSTLSQFTGKEGELHTATRRQSRVYTVNTVTLDDLLRENCAPREIDYLSIDTEGSELKILSAFDFESHDVRIITVEHNYTPDRETIHDLLSKNGFRRKLEILSRWDDWYVHT